MQNQGSGVMFADARSFKRVSPKRNCMDWPLGDSGQIWGNLPGRFPLATNGGLGNN